MLKENNTSITQTIEQKTSISEHLRQQKISNYDFLFDFKYFELKLGLVKKNNKEKTTTRDEPQPEHNTWKSYSALIHAARSRLAP